jgi:hypothetical protein
MTAQQVADQLAPLGCQATASSRLQLDVKPVSELDCIINGEQVTIDEFLNAEQIELMKTLECSPPSPLDVTTLIFVQGTNWMVSAGTVLMATKMLAVSRYRN